MSKLLYVVRLNPKKMKKSSLSATTVDEATVYRFMDTIELGVF